MVKKADLGQIAEAFVNELKKQIKVRYIYIFGSYAKGHITKDSDIDIAIISDDFTGFGFADRKKINPAILKTNINIEPHPFRTKEFNSHNPFVKEILSTGIRFCA